jgi:transposase InsO family protein
MTDNGSAYKSRLFAQALDAQGISHKRTRPYTPKTNGKADRFIQTSIREWAYAKPSSRSAERRSAMHPWLSDDNTTRPNSAPKGRPPISRIDRNNLLGNDS